VHWDNIICSEHAIQCNARFAGNRSMNRPGAPYNSNNKSVCTIKQNSVLSRFLNVFVSVMSCKSACGRTRVLETNAGPFLDKKALATNYYRAAVTTETLLVGKQSRAVTHSGVLSTRDVQNGFFKFGSVLKNRQFGFLCRSVVKYKNRVSCLSCVCILHFGRRFSKCSIGLKLMFLKFNLISWSFTVRQCP